MTQLSAIILYFLLALLIGFFSYKRQTTASGFLTGNRSLNYWLTALAAHASDMSNWLFMGYPAIVFVGGVFRSWVAIGLTLFMFLNWQFVSRKIRVLSEKTGSSTLSVFFENRLKDHSGLIRLFSAALCLLFYTIYIAAGLIGLGIIAKSMFGLPYELGILIGMALVLSYVIIGGFVTLAWLDLFQGIFLLFVIIVVPLCLLKDVGGFSGIYFTIRSKHLSFSLFPNPSFNTFFQVISMSLGWGLGYFGQPHIITKFMGINDVSSINKSKYIGMSWMSLSLLAATLVGLVGSALFVTGLKNPEMVFIEMVKQNFSPFLIGFMLCAVIAAIINVMSSQLLILSSILSEDLYKQIFDNQASQKKLLFISRAGMLVIALLAFVIAKGKPASIFTLVHYAWGGLGASFGPLLLYSLYGKKCTKMGAAFGMISGGLMAAIWPYFNRFIPFMIDPLLPAFSLSFIVNWSISRATYKETSLEAC